MSNKSVLEYLERFAKAKEMTIEQACEQKVVQEICGEYQKKENERRKNNVV